MVETADVFYISATDVEGIKINEIFRLKDLFNVKLVQKQNMLIGEYAGKEVGEGKKIQWVTDRHLKATVLRPGPLLKEDDTYNEDSLHVEEGYCEEACSKLAEGTVVQFERYGFCRLDGKKETRFVFTNP
ncbi:MAG: hypothetical protein NT157_06420 [Candidatus Micrarchaeota archaeon]|nr:hypothetical protein [Candidatus Micrarchaeota archaeon]